MASKMKSERDLRVKFTSLLRRFRDFKHTLFSVNTYTLTLAIGCSGNISSHHANNIRQLNISRELNTPSKPGKPLFSAGMNTRLFLAQARIPASPTCHSCERAGQPAYTYRGLTGVKCMPISLRGWLWVYRRHASLCQINTQKSRIAARISLSILEALFRTM